MTEIIQKYKKLRKLRYVRVWARVRGVVIIYLNQSVGYSILYTHAMAMSNQSYTYATGCRGKETDLIKVDTNSVNVKMTVDCQLARYVRRTYSGHSDVIIHI